MDFMPESTAVTSRSVPAQPIITGKRTDHHRPSSHITTTSSSYITTARAGAMLSNHLTHSPTMSSEEEQDMANCLIMLAHSVSPSDDKSDFCCRKTEKLKTRSVTEMVAGGGAGGFSFTTSAGNCNFQSYECKTCNRSFPSFQALGGHRASHKKPKLTVDDKPEYSKEYQPKLMVVYEENITVMNKLPSPVRPEPIQTGHKHSQTKVHQCSICGSEFLSGQALGGHMRRHRTAAPPSVSPMKPKLPPEVSNMNDHIVEKSPVLSLDLNLPPPEVVDEGHSNFQFAASSSQQPLVFSAAALVDCHY